MRLGVDAKGALVALFRAANPQMREIYLLTPGEEQLRSDENADLADQDLPDEHGRLSRRG